MPSSTRPLKLAWIPPLKKFHTVAQLCLATEILIILYAKSADEAEHKNFVGLHYTRIVILGRSAGNWSKNVKFCVWWNEIIENKEFVFVTPKILHGPKRIFWGDRLVHKLTFGPVCHELFVILYTTTSVRTQLGALPVYGHF